VHTFRLVAGAACFTVTQAHERGFVGILGSQTANVGESEIRVARGGEPDGKDREETAPHATQDSALAGHGGKLCHVRTC
jgi:hypothetical protein